jgi:hypothetical protein
LGGDAYRRAEQARYTIDDFYSEVGMDLPKLLPMEKFVDCGMWFKEHVAPDLDSRAVTRIEGLDCGFRLVLEDGATFFAERVVMAVGLSACESAALLHQAGADVELICRGNLVWNADPVQRSWLRKMVRRLLGQMLIPPSQVGPFPYNWVNEAPGLVAQLPQEKRSLERVNLRATAILWLRPRLKDVPVDQGRTILAARKSGHGVALALDNGGKQYDHVLLATGYRIDVAKMALLEPRLRERIAQHEGLPVLWIRIECAGTAFCRRRGRR